MQAWVSDSHTKVVANFAKDTILHHCNLTGKPFSKTLYGIGNIRKLDIVATTFTQPENQISFYINEYEHLVSADLPICGKPQEAQKIHGVQSILLRLEAFRNDEAEANRSEENSEKEEFNDRSPSGTKKADVMRNLRHSHQSSSLRHQEMFATMKSTPPNSHFIPRTRRHNCQPTSRRSFPSGPLLQLKAILFTRVSLEGSTSRHLLSWGRHMVPLHSLLMC